MENQCTSKAQQTLDQIEELIASEGDNAQTAQKIGAMLVELVTDPDFEYDSVPAFRSPANDKHPEVTAWIHAHHANGSTIAAFPHTFYGPAEKDLVHYHGQWEVITMATGKWIDFLYQPIADDPWEPGQKNVAFDRTVEVRPGEFLVMNPVTPHGTRKGQRRDCYGIMVTYIGAMREGRRMDFDPVMGMATLAAEESGAAVEEEAPAG